MVAEKIFAVLAESTRRDILQALAQESKSVGQLVEQLAVAQPTVSKHLRVLREAGVVTMRAQGQKRYYCINAEPLALISAWLDSLGAGIASPSGASALAPAVESAPVPSAVEPLPEAPTVALEAADPPEAAKVVEHTQTAPPEADALEPLVADVEAAFDPAEDHAAEELLEKVPGAAILPEAVTAAAQQSVAGTAIAKPSMGPFAGGDASVQGQISRSVGRAAGRAVDLLTNLPALPKLRRRKDQ